MPRAVRYAILYAWFAAIPACTRLTAVDWSRIQPEEASGGADASGDAGSPGSNAGGAPTSLGGAGGEAGAVDAGAGGARGGDTSAGGAPTSLGGAGGAP